MSSYQELVDSPDVDIVRTQLHPLPPTPGSIRPALDIMAGILVSSILLTWPIHLSCLLASKVATVIMRKEDSKS